MKIHSDNLMIQRFAEMIVLYIGEVYVELTLGEARQVATCLMYNSGDMKEVCNDDVGEGTNG